MGRIIKALVLLVVLNCSVGPEIHPIFLGPLVVPAFEDGTVAPVVLGFVHVFERVRLIRVGSVLVEGGDFGDILKGGICLQSLPQELRELHGARLQDLKALAHLGRKGLGLRE